MSSIIYNVFMEGSAMKISINAGRIVQMVSISCPSVVYLSNLIPRIKDVTKYRVIVVMTISTTIE